MRKSSIILIIAVFTSIINYSHSNIWDSIFSNAFSKHYDLPLKGTIQLTTKDKEEKIVDIGLITYDSKLEMLCFNLKKIKFLDDFIDFNRVTWVDFKTFITYDYQNGECSKNEKQKKMAGIVDLVFLLKSYELMTVYNDADKDYYNYFLINKDEKTNDNLSESKLSFLGIKNYLVELYQNTISDVINTTLQELVIKLESLLDQRNMNRFLQSIKFKKDPKEDSNFTFYVDKKDDSVKKIDIKYKSFKMEGLDAKYISDVDEKELQINPICLK